MTTSALYANPTTGAAWSGPLPTQAAWDPITQTFAYVPAEGAAPASAQERALLAAALARTLNGPPKARQPHKGGFITRPPMRLACPSCGKKTITVPVQAQVGPDGLVQAWFDTSKTTTPCQCPEPGCGYVGKTAKMRPYSMYEFTDLIRARTDQGPAILARIAADTSTQA